VGVVCFDAGRELSITDHISHYTAGIILPSTTLSVINITVEKKRKNYFKGLFFIRKLVHA